MIELFQNLFGGSPRHQISEILGCAVSTLFFDIARDAGIELVTLNSFMGSLLELVVPHHALVVGPDVFPSHFLCPIRAFVDENRSSTKRRRSGLSVDLFEHSVVLNEVLLHNRPRLLRDDKYAITQLCHERHRFRGHSRCVGSSLKRVLGTRSDLSKWL